MESELDTHLHEDVPHSQVSAALRFLPLETVFLHSVILVRFKMSHVNHEFPVNFRCIVIFFDIKKYFSYFRYDCR